MSDLELLARLNALVTDYLEESGDPGFCADALHELADAIFPDLPPAPSALPVPEA